MWARPLPSPMPSTMRLAFASASCRSGSKNCSKLRDMRPVAGNSLPAISGAGMTKITYEIVEHDGGWAYRVDGVFSETFPSHDMARRAAERAAREQVVPGDTTGITFEDPDGRWHDEVAAGTDRPETDVEG